MVAVLSGFDNLRDDCRRERIALIRNVLGNCEIPDEDIPFIAWIGKVDWERTVPECEQRIHSFCIPFHCFVAELVLAVIVVAIDNI